MWLFLIYAYCISIYFYVFHAYYVSLYTRCDILGSGVEGNVDKPGTWKKPDGRNEVGGSKRRGFCF